MLSDSITRIINSWAINLKMLYSKIKLTKSETYRFDSIPINNVAQLLASSIQVTNPKIIITNLLLPVIVSPIIQCDNY